MPAKKNTPPPDAATPARSVTGAELDPVDGRPVFADGMSRKRWLDSTKDDRKAALVAELKAAATEGDDPAPSNVEE